MISKQSISRIYLIAVPFLAAIIGFSIGHVSYKIYLPIWIVNTCLIGWALFILGKPLFTLNKGSNLFIAILLIIVPWVLFSIFGGMGPPPQTVEGFANAAVEQEVRYGILILGGILIVPGLNLLKDQLRLAGENLYSSAGFVLICIAIPFFILNMVYWGSYLTEAFKIFSASPEVRRPDWYLPIRSFFSAISKIEVSLIYAATAAFAASFKKAGWMNAGCCRVYISISFLAIVFNLLPSSVPMPLSAAGYFVSIPAIPFIMFYLMGINLMARADRFL